jgi:ClpP class serine protease
VPRDVRKSLIEQIENLRNSRVISYVTGDRSPCPAQVGDDAVRPLYQQIRALGQVPRLDLFLYTRGGAIDVPWRLVSALRSTAKEWNVLIPFRANSAGTLIALGADRIVLGPQGELGPIDPQMSVRRIVSPPNGPGTFVQDQISVEDVMAYVRFVEERGGIADQSARAVALQKLTDRVDPVALGNVYRTYSHIRDVAPPLQR